MAEIIRSSGETNGWGFLESWLRESVYLNCDGNIKYLLPRPYEYSNIHIRMIDPNTIYPTAKYVLKSNLETIEQLDKELASEGIDIFNLNGVVKIDENNYICPPILEVWKKPPFNNVPVIVDGAHRLYIAKKRGIEINCVEISGKISSDLPMLPLSGWDEVLEQTEVPKDKRNYHPGIPKQWKAHELYRQPFHGSTGPRIAK